MNRKFFLARAGFVVLGLVFLVSAPLCAADQWPGNGLETGGKGYVKTPMGQVHYRDLGPRTTKVPFLLLHQTHMSLVEFAQIQDELARLNIRSIAIDTPGYGMSDEPHGEPTIADFADNIVPVLDALKISKVIVAGHHTGSSIAVAFAAHHPDRVAGIILHGTPFFNDAEMAERQSRTAYDRTPKADGSHLSEAFRAMTAGNPNLPPEELRNRTYMILSMYAEGPDVGHYAVYHYHMEPDAKAIKAPGLLMTDTADAIHYLDDRMAKLRPDFTYVAFSKGDNLELMTHPALWAKMTSEWAAKLPKTAP